ncbi:MAG: type II toxin-antitoxin system RelE/ParE family toxin [Thermodesulfobacteriota bacterium]
MLFRIESFRSKETEKPFLRQWSPRFPSDVHRIALRKLLLLDAAERLEDLRIPPGNRLKKLTAKRQGQHSICTNDQWRICFRWSGGDAYEVEIADYH